MINIDGDYLEGGGQILRTSLALGGLLEKDFKITNIRARRAKPGLQPQHLTCVLAMQKICGAEVEGAELHSKELVFKPHQINSGKYIFDVRDVKESAGSVSLILQTILLPLAFSGKESRVILRGGTHVHFSPCFEYLHEIFLPTVAKMGVHTEIQIRNYGWYPEGMGEIEVRINGAEKLKPLQMVERGSLHKIEGYSFVSNLPLEIADRQKGPALKELVFLNCDKKISVGIKPSVGKGTILFLKAVHENGIGGFFTLGEINKRAEIVGHEAAKKLTEFENGTGAVDEHLADQLMLPAALAEGKTEYSAEKITHHLLTNKYTIEKFVGKEIVQIDGVGKRVEIEGIGFSRG
ncbi:MAG: RNA 3'-terminal phosphate cyclase [Candidatus Micrarchaeota archaeon]